MHTSELREKRNSQSTQCAAVSLLNIFLSIVKDYIPIRFLINTQDY